MWTSCSSNHTSEHHSPLSSQPYVVVAAVLRLRSAHAEDPAAAALDIDRQLSQTPLLNRAARAHRTRATGQGFALDAAFIRPHAPNAVRVRRDEVDVGAFGRERRVKAQRSSALEERDLVDIIDEDDEILHTDPAEHGLALCGRESERLNGRLPLPGRQNQVIARGSRL